MAQPMLMKGNTPSDTEKSVSVDDYGNLKTSQSGPATDRSGTITTGGTAQNAMAANTSRRSWTVINTSDTAMRVHAAGTASATVGVTLNPGDAATGTETNAISIHCATTGKAFTAWEN